MGRLSVLSPRRLDRELEDWARAIRSLVAHQRVDRRRRVARRARRLGSGRRWPRWSSLALSRAPAPWACAGS